MVVHNRKLTCVHKKRYHKSLKRNCRNYTKKIMRGGNVEELNMKLIGQYYDLHIYETNKLLVKKNEPTVLTEEEDEPTELTEADDETTRLIEAKETHKKIEYLALPISLIVSIATNLDGSNSMTVDTQHLEKIIKKHAELSGIGIKAITNSVNELKQKIKKSLDKTSLLPVVSVFRQAQTRRTNRVDVFVKLIFHTRRLSLKNFYDTAFMTYRVYGAPGVAAEKLMGHFTKAALSHPSHIADKAVTKFQERFRDSILLNNEVITRYYDIKVDNEDRHILYIKEAFKAKSVLPEYLIPTSVGVDRKDGKLKIILTEEEYIKIKQIPNVRNLTDIHVLSNFAALIPGEKHVYDEYYREVDKRSGVNINYVEAHDDNALNAYYDYAKKAPLLANAETWGDKTS